MPRQFLFPASKYLLYLALWLGLCIAYLVAEHIEHTTLIYVFKPMLVSCLAVYFYSTTRSYPSRFRNLIVAALVFSVSGDSILMLEEQGGSSGLYFIFGLASFLLAHLCYLMAFRQVLPEQKGLFALRPIWWPIIGLYLLLNIGILWPDLPPDMKVPVPLYCIAILSMTAACMHLFPKIPRPVFMVLMSGVLLFVFSDTIIGLNKFKLAQLSIPSPRLFIMIPYLLAQLLITIACCWLATRLFPESNKS